MTATDQAAHQRLHDQEPYLALAEQGKQLWIARHRLESAAAFRRVVRQQVKPKGVVRHITASNTSLVSSSLMYSGVPWVVQKVPTRRPSCFLRNRNSTIPPRPQRFSPKA